MELEKRMEKYKNQVKIMPREAKILETICKSQEAFYVREQERMLTYLEFLWIQFRLVRKKWWLLQFAFLSGIGMILFNIQEDYYIHRTMGVAGVLFVIFAIPELWKNRSCGSMEIESSAYYSLKQIYAARILLFGMIDLCLLTVFCTVLLGKLQLTVSELLAQFLLPLMVTACICFGTLCSKYAVNETVSITLCFGWCALWWFITINDQIYSAIFLPVWLFLFGLALLLLSVFIYKTLHNCNQCWEVRLNGIENN